MRGGAPALILALSVSPASALAAEVIDVPSGQLVTFYDTVANEPGPGGLTIRFRFVAPQIARDVGTISFETAEGDMAHLCESYALPRLSDIGPRVSQIVITLMDRPVPFGATVPEATQFFEAYRPEDGRCVWEGF
jgi:hypothetical protein